MFYEKLWALAAKVCNFFFHFNLRKKVNYSKLQNHGDAILVVDVPV